MKFLLEGWGDGSADEVIAHRLEYLSSIPQTHVKPRMVVNAYDPDATEAKSRGSWELTDQPG